MNIESLNNEEQLFRQIVKDDEEAFRKIFLHYYPRLVSFAFKFVKREDLAQEIAQEALTRLWQHRNTFNQTNYLGSWLFKVVSNLAYNFLKRAAAEQKLMTLLASSPVAESDSLSDLDYKYSKEVIHNVVRQMPPQRRVVFNMSREEGLSYKEIAEKLNISTNTVKNHLVKALETIREALKGAIVLILALFH